MLDLSGLNREQKQVAAHAKGPLLVVAGAGTGKTQALAYRIASLIAKGVNPSQLLAITFTDKAAREMETRVSELLGRFVLDVKITTFNSFGHEILQRYALDIGLNRNLQLLNSQQQLIFINDHIDELKLDYYSPVTNPTGLLSDLLGFFSRLSSELVTPSQYQHFASQLLKSAKSPEQKLESKRHQELARAYKLYQHLKQREGVIDFDDQVALTVELLERRPNLLAKLQQEIQYILVDEFQDTNPVQSRLIDQLAGKGSASTANLMVVGDDDQSIYRFRGAAIANILDFKARYPKAKQIALIQNYRSSQEILDAAYRLIQFNNPERLESKYRLNKQLVGQFHADPPRLATFLSHEEEARWVAEDIKRKLAAGTAASEIAVLLRKNSQSRIVATYLELAGVDYQIIGETEDLYRCKPVRLILNFLQVVGDPNASEPLFHLLVSDAYGLEAAGLRDLVSRARRERRPLEDMLRESLETAPNEVGQKLQQFFIHLDHWRMLLPDASVGNLAYQFLNTTGYLKKLVARSRRDPSLDEHIYSLNQFFTSLAEYERIAIDKSAVGYLVALPSLLGTRPELALEDLPDIYGEKVRVLTIHKAKGLEFEVVYIFDLNQDTFPSRRQVGSLEIPEELLKSYGSTQVNPHLQEERRLMYVAMTRAKKELILTYAPDHGGKLAKKPSIFIEEALGETPALSAFKLNRRRVDQIELFKAVEPSKPNQLPANIQKGDRLFLNAHMVEDYQMCPAEFYLRYILAPPQPLSFSLEYGNLMHGLVQFYNRRRLDQSPPSLEELLEYLRTGWPKEGFVSEGHAKRSLKQAVATVRRFYNRESKLKRYPRYIELSFEFDLPRAKTTMRGRFDAVYAEADEVEIRDYKTGAATTNTQERADQRSKDSLQLGVYALAWQKLQSKTVNRLTLDFIDSGLIGSSRRTDRQLANLENKIGEVAERIRAGDFRPQGTHVFCTHQEYGF